MPKVITPAQQGAQSLGNLVFEPTALPFQRTRLPGRIDPDPTGAGSLLAQAGKFTAEVLPAITGIAEAIKKSRDEASLLELDDQFVVSQQNARAGYKDRGSYDAAGNPVLGTGVFGANANNAWLETYVDSRRDVMREITESEKFKELDKDAQIALLSKMQANFLADRGLAIKWMIDQTDAALKRAREDHNSVNANAQRGATDALLALDTTTKLAAGMRANAAEEDAPETVDQKIVDETTANMVIAVTNVMESDNPDKVAVAKAMVAAFALSLKKAGIDIPMGSNEVNDVLRDVETDSMRERVKLALPDIHAEEPDNINAAVLLYDPNNDKTSEEVDEFRRQWEQITTGETAARAAELRDAHDVARAQVNSGQPLTEAMKRLLDAHDLEAYEVLLNRAIARQLYPDQVAVVTDPMALRIWDMMSLEEKDALDNNAKIEAKFGELLSIQDLTDLTHTISEYREGRRKEFEAKNLAYANAIITAVKNLRSINNSSWNAQRESLIRFALGIKELTPSAAQQAQIDMATVMANEIMRSELGRDVEFTLDDMNRFARQGAAQFADGRFVLGAFTDIPGLGMTPAEQAAFPDLDRLPPLQLRQFAELFIQDQGFDGVEPIKKDELNRFVQTVVNLSQSRDPEGNPYYLEEETYEVISAAVVANLRGGGPFSDRRPFGPGAGATDLNDPTIFALWLQDILDRPTDYRGGSAVVEADVAEKAQEREDRINALSAADRESLSDIQMSRILQGDLSVEDALAANAAAAERGAP
jgi:hypothetical protein